MTDSATLQAFYDRWARIYDVIARAPGVRSWRRQTVETLDLEEGDTVVEMGVGTGANLPYLRDAVGATGRVIGLDLAPGMLTVARRRAARAGWTNVALCRADATQPPLTEPVDAILGSFVIALFEDPPTVVATWLDSLCDGGRLALLDASRSDAALAAPLNLGFRAFLRLTAPGRPPWRADHPARRLDSRLDAADHALSDRTTRGGETRLAAGFVRLRWGQRQSAI